MAQRLILCSLCVAASIGADRRAPRPTLRSQALITWPLIYDVSGLHSPLMRGAPSVNLFIKCSEPCVSWAGRRSQSYFHLFCVSPLDPSVLSFRDCPPVKLFLFISKGEDWRTSSLAELVGASPVCASLLIS